jgi:chromosome segregation ATPase
MSRNAKLDALANEIAQLRREIQILDEQITFQEEVSGEASLRAIVSETPLADREADEAGRDLDRLKRVKAEAERSLERLSVEVDKLLDEGR